MIHLDRLPTRQPAYVDHVHWDWLSDAEAQRLREFGICEGASVELLHRSGLFGRGALACRIGRMTIAMRRNHAAAIVVRTGAHAAAPGHPPGSAHPVLERDSDSAITVTAA